MREHPLLGKTIEYDGPAQIMFDGTEFRYIGQLDILEFDGNERGQWVNVWVTGEVQIDDLNERSWLTIDSLPEILYFPGRALPQIGDALQSFNEDTFECMWHFEDLFDRYFH